MNKISTKLYELGSVLRQLMMVIGLDVGKVSATNMYDVACLKIGKHQVQGYVNYEGIYYTLMFSESLNKCVAIIELFIGKDAIIQYF